MCFTFKRNCWRSRASNGLSCASALWVGVVSPRRLVLGPYLCVDRVGRRADHKVSVWILLKLFSPHHSAVNHSVTYFSRGRAVYLLCAQCVNMTHSPCNKDFYSVFFFYTSFFCYLSVLGLQLLAAAKCYQRSYVKWVLTWLSGRSSFPHECFLQTTLVNILMLKEKEEGGNRQEEKNCCC